MILISISWVNMVLWIAVSLGGHLHCCVPPVALFCHYQWPGGTVTWLGRAGTLEITPPMADIHHNNLKQSIQMFSWHQRDASIFTSHLTPKALLVRLAWLDFWSFYADFPPEINDFLLTLYFHHRSASAPRYIDWMLLMVPVPGSEGMGTRSWGWQGRVEPPSRHHGGSGPPPPPRVEQRFLRGR